MIHRWALAFLCCPGPAMAGEPLRLQGDVMLLADQAALFSAENRARAAAPGLPGAHLWTRGILAEGLPARTAADRAAGLTVTPLRDPSLSVALEVINPADASGALQSSLTWRYVWENARSVTEPLVWGFATNGVLGMTSTTATQQIAPYMDYRVTLDGDRSLRMRFQQEAQYDVTGDKWDFAFAPQIRHEQVVPLPGGSLSPKLSLSAGFRLTPDKKPDLTTGIQLIFSPPA